MRFRILLCTLALVWVLFGAGCSSLFQVDLASRRQANLEKDLDVLNRDARPPVPDSLGLAEAVRLGLEHNLDLRIARLQEEIDSDAARAERFRMLPALDVRADVSERNNFPVNEFQNIQTGEVDLSNTISRERNRKTVEVRLTWNILDFGLSYYRARQAAVQTEISRMDRTRQAQILAMDISAAYLKSVLAENNLAYLQRMAEELREYKETADDMVAERRLDPITAKDLERQLAALSIEASDLQAEISGMRIELCRLMGVNPMTRFALADDDDLLDRLRRMLPDPEALAPQRLERIALRNRPELYAADLRERARQDEARSALLRMFPGLRLEGALDYDDNKFLINNTWLSVGAGLVSDLLALPGQYSEWKAREKGVDRAELDRLLMTAGVIVQVHMALHEFEVKREQFRLRETAWSISDDLLSMSRERNEAGMQGFADTVVTRRMMESVVARLERDRSLVELLTAYQRLLVSMGLEYGRWQQDVKEMNPEAIPDRTEPADEAEGGAVEETNADSESEEAADGGMISLTRFPQRDGSRRFLPVG